MRKKTAGRHRSKILRLLLGDSPGQSGGLLPPPPSTPSSPSPALLPVTLAIPALTSSSAPSVVPPSVPALPYHGEAMVVKVEPTEEPVVSASADSAISESPIKLLDLPESSTSAAKKVIELSDDESEGLAALDVPTSAVPAEASPSAPRIFAHPGTSGDEEFARALFITLNREALGIPGDGGLVDLVSDEEDYGASSGGEQEGGVASGEEKKEEAASGDASPFQATASPSPPPSA
ncbi:unnamed protein product [Miscanthus lutarioriparius]|uniref:Uncharacterized protein n=1 Tax=Miscanthus lutarioriparius TaxID=422564 RepID=A0A811SN34_9POAL|nr:unnamed protein product [Miscanthus lutarioriparius]